jgi:hypothetical protein
MTALMVTPRSTHAFLKDLCSLSGTNTFKLIVFSFFFSMFSPLPRDSATRKNKKGDAQLWFGGLQTGRPRMKGNGSSCAAPPLKI